MRTRTGVKRWMTKINSQTRCETEDDEDDDDGDDDTESDSEEDDVDVIHAGAHSSPIASVGKL